MQNLIDKMTRILFIVFLSIFSANVFAQNDTKNDSTSTDLAFEKLVLPELEVCVQLALNNSWLVKANQLEIDILLEEIKIKKKSWLDNIQIEANTRYGLYNQISLSQEVGSTASDIALQSAKEQFNYFAGLTLKLPLSYFSINKSEQKIKKINIKEVELKREQLKKEISVVIIAEYFKFKSLSELVDAHQNNLLTAQLDYMRGKSEVKVGMLGLTEFAAMSNAYTKALDAFTGTKNDYYAQFYLLKLLTGSNLQKDKK